MISVLYKIESFSYDSWAEESHSHRYPHNYTTDNLCKAVVAEFIYEGCGGGGSYHINVIKNRKLYLYLNCIYNFSYGWEGG